MIYRLEHPKPQFERPNWLNLNGSWQFELDPGNSGKDRNFFEPAISFSQNINVPFCPESKLSGLAHTDFMNSVWYKRTFTLSAQQVAGNVFVHFGAVDYFATIYINGKKCGEHKGGYVSFAIDITDYVTEGENSITIHAQDDSRNRLIPRGKQSDTYNSYGCLYTRTTGIWQTVWLEFVPKTYIKKVKYYSNLQEQTVTIHADLIGSGDFSIEASFEGKPMGKVSLKKVCGYQVITLPLKEKHLWEVGQGRLYDLTLKFENDIVYSYFGLRSIQYTDFKFYLNGKSVFQRLVLDQGFYPDGIYTAPSDEELAADVDRSMAMGFNGARLHEKVFEERFLYHCDKKGYMVWGEYPNWGLDLSYADAINAILPEWLEEIDRDFNHPSIVGWCPFNETWDCNGRKQYDWILSLMYHATKAADTTRPCIDTSGTHHVITDIFDVHDYEQNPKIFASHYENFSKDGSLADFDPPLKRQIKYDFKRPFFISEFGGIRWTEDTKGWGYGQAPTSPEEFLERLKGLTDVILDNDKMFGFCYTQLTDIEQEQNGLYTYDRKAKFNPALIHPILSRKAAIED